MRALAVVELLEAGEVDRLADRRDDEVGRDVFLGAFDLLDLELGRRRIFASHRATRSAVARPSASAHHATGASPPRIAMPSASACSTSCLFACILSTAKIEVSVTSAPCLRRHLGDVVRRVAGDRVFGPVLLAGLQTVQPSLYEAATLDGASKWEMFRYITYPLLTPIIAVVMTFSVLFTFTDFQLIWAMTRGGPVNATHLMATLSYQRAIIAGQLGEGAAISSAMIPFLLAAIMVSWFGLQRRKWQQGENND